MKVIFCADTLQTRRPDPAYAEEVAAVEQLGIDYALVSYEALVEAQDAAKAVRQVAAQAGEELSLYRGWMLRPAQYRQLYEALAERGVRLINDPAAYTHCHYLPESYAVIAGHTPRSLWFPLEIAADTDTLMERLQSFGAAPLIVKDYVKSRKHEWYEACYIPSAADPVAVQRVVRRFIELQGADLNEGLVFREFVELAPLGTHPQSGMPLTQEFRRFVLDGASIYTTGYWTQDGSPAGLPPQALFGDVAHAVRSRFFTLDVARQRSGEWLIVELGDGQVAGLPDQADALTFYQALLAHWPQ